MLAAILRLWNLQLRGMQYWDEAKFALEGVRMQAALAWLAHGHAHLAAGKAVGTAKPTHALLFGLAYTVFGIHDWVAFGVAAVCSIVAVALTFFLARRLFSVPAALFAAALLAVSEYEVIYARSALSESDATMMFLIATLVWIGTRPALSIGDSYGCLALAAGVFGLSFTTNYRLSVFIGSIVFLDLFPLLIHRTFRYLVFRGIIWGVGLLVCPLLWQLAGSVCAHYGVFLFRNELTGIPTSYLSEAAYQIHGGKQSVIRFSPLPYLQWFAVRQGPVDCVLVLIGFAAAAWKRSWPWLVAVVPIVLPYVVYVFAPFIVPRNMEVALPFTSIIAAAGTLEAARLLSLPRVRLALVTAVALVAISLGAWMSWRLTGERSGFVAAGQYVREHGQKTLLTTSEDMVFYFPGNGNLCMAPAMPLRFSILRWYLRHGYRYAVLERHRAGVADYVRTHAHLAGSYLLTGPLDIGENPINSENTHPPNPSDPPDTVLVYDVKGLRLPTWVHAATRPRPCIQDVVT